MKPSQNSFTQVVLRLLSYPLVATWLVSWAYCASKMSAFEDVGYRHQALILEIVVLNLWSLCFALRMAGREPFASSDPRQIEFKTRQSLGSYVPFGFSLCLALIALVNIPLLPKNHPNWPAPSVPAEICFAPMVFVFAGLNKYQRQLGKADPRRDAETND